MNEKLPKIRDTIMDRVGIVLWVNPGEGASVSWRKGWSEFMTAEQLNSGRYELV